MKLNLTLQRFIDPEIALVLDKLLINCLLTAEMQFKPLFYCTEHDKFHWKCEQFQQVVVMKEKQQKNRTEL